MAIQSCIQSLKAALNIKWLESGTIVPIPCSKALGHPDYDDRIEQICRGLSPNADVRRLVVQTHSTAASHEAGDGDRLSVDDLLGVYRIDESLANPEPTSIGIFDDVLTAGTHYRAMHSVLSARFPAAKVYGIFIARRVFPDPFEDLLG